MYLESWIWRGLKVGISTSDCLEKSLSTHRAQSYIIDVDINIAERELQ